MVNAHPIKQVPGRKTDSSDAAWIAGLRRHGLRRHGLVRPSFIPALDAEVARRLAPFEDEIVVAVWDTIPGVGRRTAEDLRAEIGPQLAPFPAAARRPPPIWRVWQDCLAHQTPSSVIQAA